MYYDNEPRVELIKIDNIPQAGKTSLRGLIRSVTLEYSNEGDKLIFIDNRVFPHSSNNLTSCRDGCISSIDAKKRPDWRLKKESDSPNRASFCLALPQRIPCDSALAESLTAKQLKPSSHHLICQCFLFHTIRPAIRSRQTNENTAFKTCCRHSHLAEG